MSVTVESVLAEVDKHAENDCCHDDAWRGRYCQYHLGMRDGVEVAFALLEEAAAARGEQP